MQSWSLCGGLHLVCTCCSGGSANGWRKAQLTSEWEPSHWPSFPLQSLAAATVSTLIISTQYGCRRKCNKASVATALAIAEACCSWSCCAMSIFCPCPKFFDCTVVSSYVLSCNNSLTYLWEADFAHDCTVLVIVPNLLLLALPLPLPRVVSTVSTDRDMCSVWHLRNGNTHSKLLIGFHCSPRRLHQKQTAASFFAVGWQDSRQAAGRHECAEARPPGVWG